MPLRRLSAMEQLGSFQSFQQTSALPVGEIADTFSTVTKQSQPSWITSLRHKASTGLKGQNHCSYPAENKIPGEKAPGDIVSITRHSNPIFAPANHHPGLLASIMPGKIDIDSRVRHNGSFRSSTPSNTSSVGNPLSDEPPMAPPEILEPDAQASGIKDATPDGPLYANRTDGPSPDPATARQQYHAQQGSYWENAKGTLAASFLHPVNLTEPEFVSFVCSHGEERLAWFEKNLTHVIQRAVGQWIAAYEMLVNAGIPEKELSERIWDAVELMDQPEHTISIHSYRHLQSHILMDAASLNLTREEHDKFMSLALSKKYDFVKDHRVHQLEGLWDTKKSACTRSYKPKAKGVVKGKAAQPRTRKAKCDEGNCGCPNRSQDSGSKDGPLDGYVSHLRSRQLTMATTPLKASDTSSIMSPGEPRVIENIPPRLSNRTVLTDLSEALNEADVSGNELDNAPEDASICSEEITLDVGEQSLKGPQVCEIGLASRPEKNRPPKRPASTISSYSHTSSRNYDDYSINKSLNMMAHTSATPGNAVTQTSPFADPETRRGGSKSFSIEFVERRTDSKTDASAPPAHSYESVPIELLPRNGLSSRKVLRKKISSFFGTLARREKAAGKDTDV